MPFNCFSIWFFIEIGCPSEPCIMSVVCTKVSQGCREDRGEEENWGQSFIEEIIMLHKILRLFVWKFLPALTLEISFLLQIEAKFNQLLFLYKIDFRERTDLNFFLVKNRKRFRLHYRYTNARIAINWIRY